MPKPVRIDPGELVGSAEAAKILDKHVRTVHRFTDLGVLKPAMRYPGKTGGYLFRRADVEALAARLNESRESA